MGAQLKSTAKKKKIHQQNPQQSNLKVANIFIIGSSFVGKTHLIHRYIRGPENFQDRLPAGIEYSSKKIEHRNERYQIKIWDICLIQAYFKVIEKFLEKIKGHKFIIVFDVTNKYSFQSVEKIYSMCLKLSGSPEQLLLVGNKIDCQSPVISYHQGKAKAQKLNISYHQVSAKTGQNVQQLFQTIIKQYHYRRIQKQIYSGQIRMKKEDRNLTLNQIIQKELQFQSYNWNQRDNQLISQNKLSKNEDDNQKNQKQLVQDQVSQYPKNDQSRNITQLQKRSKDAVKQLEKQVRDYQYFIQKLYQFVKKTLPQQDREQQVQRQSLYNQSNNHKKVRKILSQYQQKLILIWVEQAAKHKLQAALHNNNFAQKEKMQTQIQTQFPLLQQTSNTYKYDRAAQQLISNWDNINSKMIQLYGQLSRNHRIMAQCLIKDLKQFLERALSSLPGVDLFNSQQAINAIIEDKQYQQIKVREGKKEQTQIDCDMVAYNTHRIDKLQRLLRQNQSNYEDSIRMQQNENRKHQLLILQLQEQINTIKKNPYKQENIQAKKTMSLQKIQSQRQKYDLLLKCTNKQQIDKQRGKFKELFVLKEINLQKKPSQDKHPYHQAVEIGKKIRAQKQMQENKQQKNQSQPKLRRKASYQAMILKKIEGLKLKRIQIERQQFMLKADYEKIEFS